MFFHAPESERRNAFPRRSTPRTGAKKAPPGRHAAAVPAECGFPRREQRCRHDGRPGVHAERDAEEGLFRPRADRRPCLVPHALPHQPQPDAAAPQAWGGADPFSPHHGQRLPQKEAAFPASFAHEAPASLPGAPSCPLPQVKKIRLRRACAGLSRFFHPIRRVLRSGPTLLPCRAGHGQSHADQRDADPPSFLPAR